MIAIRADRGQKLSPTEQLAAVKHFGEPCFYPFAGGMDEVPQMTPIVTTFFSALAHSATRLKPGARRFFSPALTSSSFQMTTLSSADDSTYSSTPLQRGVG